MSARGVRLLLILSVFACARLNAVTLDWSAVSWTAGSLGPNSYNIDPSSPGNDITVTISGNTSQLVTDPLALNVQTPAIVTALEGGMGSGTKTLDLGVNFANISQSITVTVTFSAAYTAGVKNVSFKLFDVDFQNVSGSTYQDEIRLISATTISNTAVAATVTGSANNSVTGSGTLAAKVDGSVSTVDTGATSGNANVTIDFGTNAIKSFTFTYGSGSGLGAINPTFQHVGIYNIGYTPVPESNPALASAFSCVAALLLAFWHHARVRKKNL